MSDSLTLPIEDTIYAIAEFNQTLFIARQTGLFGMPTDDDKWENLYESWMPDTPIPTLDIALSPNFADDNILIAGVNGGIMLSSDAGKTWVAHQFRNPVPMVTCVVFSPQFQSDQTILAGTYEDGMFRSTDGGKTWQVFNHGLFDHNILCLALAADFADSHTVYVGTSSGIYKSSNGGRLWENIPLSIGYDAIVSLAIASNGTMYAGTEANGILQSTDDGVTWSTLYEADDAVNAILADSPDKLIIQVGDTIQVASDNSRIWNTLVGTDATAINLSQDKQSLIVGLADTTIKIINL